MANKNLWPEPFDPDAKYMAFKKLKVGTATLYEGNPIPDGAFTLRRLRQLYDARRIRKMTEKQIALSGAPTMVAPPVPVVDPIDDPSGNPKYFVRQRSPGWFEVCNPEGDPVTGALRKDEASARSHELNA